MQNQKQTRQFITILVKIFFFPNLEMSIVMTLFVLCCTASRLTFEEALAERKRVDGILVDFLALCSCLDWYL